MEKRADGGDHNIVSSNPFDYVKELFEVTAHSTEGGKRKKSKKNRKSRKKNSKLLRTSFYGVRKFSVAEGGGKHSKSRKKNSKK